MPNRRLGFLDYSLDNKYKINILLFLVCGPISQSPAIF